MFENLKILDLSTVLAGPSVATFFAELGADVIKIEDVNHRDVTRSWRLEKEKKDSVSAYFSSVNYRKKHLVLDFTDRKDLRTIQEYVKKSDIVISNFRNEVAVKLGLDKKSLFSINSKLILGRIQGFSYNENRPAYDMILQAECGFLSMSGTKNGGPQKMPVAMIDVMAAHQLKEGILIALIERTKNIQFTSKEVLVCLDVVGISSLVNQASNYLMTGYVPESLGNIHPNIAPYGEIFESSDKVSFTLAVGTDKQFTKFWKFLFNSRIPEKFSSNQQRVIHRNKMNELIQKKCQQKKYVDIHDFCLSSNIPFGEVKTIDKVLSSPDVKKMIKYEEIQKNQTKRLSSIAFEIR